MDTVLETLTEINKDMTQIMKHKNNQMLQLLLEHALLPQYKFKLPEGIPPFKVNEMNHVQTKGIFWQEIKKFGTYLREDVRQIQREHIFIQALEALDGESQKILLAIKDQTLDQLFPNITLENLKKVGYA